MGTWYMKDHRKANPHMKDHENVLELLVAAKIITRNKKLLAKGIATNGARSY